MSFHRRRAVHPSPFAHPSAPMNAPMISVEVWFLPNASWVNVGTSSSRKSVDIPMAVAHLSERSRRPLRGADWRCRRKGPPSRGSAPHRSPDRLRESRRARSSATGSGRGHRWPAGDGDRSGDDERWGYSYCRVSICLQDGDRRVARHRMAMACSIVVQRRGGPATGTPSHSSNKDHVPEINIYSAHFTHVVV